MRPPTTLIDMLPRGLAVALGITATEPGIACRVRGAQIASIKQTSLRALVATLLATLLLLGTLYNAGSLHSPVVIWCCLLLAACAFGARFWRGRSPHAASPQAIWRTVIHGACSGAAWGALPLLAPAGSGDPARLVTGITAGAMWAGSLILAPVPAAGFAYIVMIAAGASLAVLRHGEAGLLAPIWAYAAMNAIGVCAIAHHIAGHIEAVCRLQAEMAARERVDAELSQSRRMSALGTLSVGVAHDFNNILQSVTVNATLLARGNGTAQQTRRLAGSILDATGRGSAISRRLLAFARQESPGGEPVAVHDILHKAGELLEHTLHRSIRLGVTVAPDLPPALADRAQLETVLVNLAANARDAMPRGGTLALHATAETVKTRAISPNLAPGRYVRIVVTDNGTGMDAATLARAAEPFFTTKPKGKGTGLGLALARDFAEQYAGAIASQLGRGTEVTLWLPQARAAPAAPIRTFEGELVSLP
jgi:signal transduction histidine kinase